MPPLEQRYSPLFKLLNSSLFVALPQYEFSLPQDRPLSGSKVYLIHLDIPLKHARRYLGYSENVKDRLQKHRNGQGAAFMNAVAKEGITWNARRQLFPTYEIIAATILESWP